MCGRFVTNFSTEELVQYLEESVSDSVKTDVDYATVIKYNAAPTHMLPAIIPSDESVMLTLLRWGLVPKWAKDPSIGPKMINARVETVHEKPSFRGLLKNQRCVVPMRGFYEWRRPEHGPKEPFYATRQDNRPMMVAGLWTQSPALGEVRTFCTLTTEAIEPLASIHHRAPVVLEDECVNDWLTGDDALAIARLPIQTELRLTRVSTRVNSVRNDDPSLINPVANEQLFE